MNTTTHDSEPMTNRSQLSALAEPFDPCDIKWRVARTGTNSKGIWCVVQAYVTARAIQNRLDDVVGQANWALQRPEIFASGAKSGFACGISIKVGDEWVTKWDVSETTGIDPIKGGFSGAMKRAGYQWGIGRYLYHIEEKYAEVSATEMRGPGWNYARMPKDKGGEVYYWKTPTLPGWAMPKDDGTVSDDQVNELKRVWKSNHAPNVTKKEDLRTGFERFVEQIVGSFPVGDPTCWTVDAYAKVVKLANVPEDESGIDNDVPFE